MKNKLLIPIVAFLSIQSQAFDDSYFHIQEEDTSYQLQTAVKKLASRYPNNPEIILVGVSHIGDASYYAKLQSILDRAGHVLYEEITSAFDKYLQDNPDKSLFPPEDKEANRLLIGHRLEAQQLGLAAQIDQINYNRPHFVRSDTPMEILWELGGYSILKHFVNASQAPLILSEVKSITKQTIQKRSSSFKKEALQMKEAENCSLVGNLTNGTTSACCGNLIVKRNLIVLNDLERLLATGTQKSIAIFYGAAHMKDLEETIKDWGYELTEEDWVKAMQFLVSS